MRLRSAILWGLLIIGTAGCGRPGTRNLRAGLRELRRGRDVGALARFERALARQPSGMAAAVAWNGIGVAAARLNQVDRAAEAFIESQRLDPDAPEPVLNLGVLRYRAGDPVAAAPLLVRAAMMAPDDPEALEHLGALHLGGGRPETARSIWRRALERAPDSPRILTALGLAEVGVGDAEAAMAAFRAALEADPGYAPALYNLFVLLDRAWDRPEEARDYGERFLRTRLSAGRVAAVRARLHELAEAAPDAAPPPPPEPVEPEVTPPAEPEPAVPAHARFLDEARAFFEAGEPVAAVERAIEAAESARRAQAPEARTRALRFALEHGFDQPRAHLAWGRHALEEDRTDAARQAFEHALALDPGRAGAHYGLARLAMRAGEHDVALVRLRRAIEADALFPDAPWDLARLQHMTLRRPAEAARAYRAFAQRFPADPRAPRALALARELADEAATPPEEPPPPRPAPAPAAPRPPPRPEGLPRPSWRPSDPDPEAARRAFAQGAQLQERRDLERAAYFYQRAFELDGSLVRALYNLATVHHERGRLDDAMAVYYEVLARAPGHTAARHNVAVLHHARREREPTLAHLVFLTETAPAYAPTWYLLGLLHSERADGREDARAAFRRFLEEAAPDDPARDSVRRWMERHGQPG